MSPEPTVVIWRSALLAASETFVRDHGAALTRWRPRYLGATKVASHLAEDGDVIAFPDRRGFPRLRLTGSSPRLRGTLADLAPQVVHAHFGGDGWLVSRAAADLGVPLVVTVHGHDVTRQPAAPGLRGLRYRRNLRSVFRRAAVVLAVSAHIRARAIACGADPATVRVHHTGVPVPDAVPEVPKTWDVAFVGRFVEKKGVDDLLAALALMPGRPRALIVGSGPLESEVRARAAGLDVTFPGAQTPEQVARYLAASRILAAPSKTARDGDSEGLPTTILEAAARGLPVAATRHSGIPEGVLDGETGLLSAEADPAGLAANLTRLLGDDALRARLGAGGRAHVEAHFDLRKQSLLLEDLYDELAVSAATSGAGRRPARLKLVVERAHRWRFIGCSSASRPASGRGAGTVPTPEGASGTCCATYSRRGATSSAPVTRNARPKARRRSARSRQPAARCRDAPRPGVRRRGSGTSRRPDGPSTTTTRSSSEAGER